MFSWIIALVAPVAWKQKMDAINELAGRVELDPGPPQGFTDAGLPVFAPLPGFRRDKLDIRPVIWCLENHPDDFTSSEHTLKHVPSEHEFWISSGAEYLSLYRAGGCSCLSRTDGFQYGQRKQLWDAYKRWQRRTDTPKATELREHFAGHFVYPKKEVAAE